MTSDGPKIDLLPAERHVPSETLVFDVVVEGMGMIGRWVQRNGIGGSVTWTDGKIRETGDCDGDPVKIAAALVTLVPAQARVGMRG